MYKPYRIDLAFILLLLIALSALLLRSATAEPHTQQLSCTRTTQFISDDRIITECVAETPPTPTTPAPQPTVTATPIDECDTLIAHGWETPPCPGEPTHTHFGIDTTAVPASEPNAVFGDWRGNLQLQRDIDCGFRFETINESALKAHGCAWVVHYDLACTHNADTCITDSAILYHRMSNAHAQGTRYHSALWLFRLSDGTLVYRGAWSDFGHAQYDATGNAEPIENSSDTIFCPAGEAPGSPACFDAPCEAVPFHDGGPSYRRLVPQAADGTLQGYGFWYGSAGNYCQLPYDNMLQARFDNSNELTSDGTLHAHLTVLHLFGDNYPINTLVTTDVFGCLQYGACGDYHLPDAQRDAGVFYLSQETGRIICQQRFDDNELSVNICVPIET